MRSEYRDAIVEYIDNEDQLGRLCEPDELVDVLREFEDHPRDDQELHALVISIVNDLLDDRVVEGHGMEPGNTFTLGLFPR